jgi:hypothetical protein
MRKPIIDKKKRFTTKSRFLSIMKDTLKVEKRISDGKDSSTIGGMNTTLDALLDVHNANFKEFAEDVQSLIPQNKQGNLEKLIKFYSA